MVRGRYLRIADALRARIRQGTYEPNELLPTEAALGGEFGMALGSVRRALAVLEHEGLIIKGRGQRARVRPAVLRAPVLLAPGDTLIGRMPRGDDADEMDLDPGTGLLQVTRADGTVEVFLAHEVVVINERARGDDLRSGGLGAEPCRRATGGQAIRSSGSGNCRSQAASGDLPRMTR